MEIISRPAVVSTHHNPDHCVGCSLIISKLKTANSILRKAMYDIIELESQHPGPATITQVFAENALDKSAIHEDDVRRDA